MINNTTDDQAPFESALEFIEFMREAILQKNLQRNKPVSLSEYLELLRETLEEVFEEPGEETPITNAE